MDIGKTIIAVGGIILFRDSTTRPFLPGVIRVLIDLGGEGRGA